MGIHASTLGTSVIYIRNQHFRIFSENLFQEILTLKDFFDIYFHYVLCLVPFLNRKEKTFSV